MPTTRSGAFLVPRKNSRSIWKLKTQPNLWGNSCVAKVYFQRTWLESARQVKEGALTRLSAKPGPKQAQVSNDAYRALKSELEDKERALADLAVELAILRKKTNGGSWDR
jgi:hypothetical protein